MADYVSGTDFLHSFEEGFGDKNVFLRSRCAEVRVKAPGDVCCGSVRILGRGEGLL